MESEVTFQERWAKFCANPENDVYFSNKKEEKFKTFPDTKKIILELAEGEMRTANAHAFVLWKHFSVYIHYSTITEQFETGIDTRHL